MMRWILLFLIYGAIDFYAFQAFKTTIKTPWAQWIYWLLTALVLGNLIYQFYGIERKDFGLSHSYAVAFFITLLIPKLFPFLIMLIEDLFRVIIAGYWYFAESGSQNYFPSRRKFISQIALGIAAIPFASILYGITKGKYNFKVLKYTLHFEDLPKAFDGYQITQISDIHSGSFDSYDKVAYAVDLINEQNSDVIFFTGDMVNNEAKEMLPYKDLFNKLSAKDGMFSVLGNHDYGDYIPWNSEAEKTQNLEDLKTLQKQIGFDLLLNESRYIEKDGQRLAILGVENWGAGGFKKAGDLQKASEKIAPEDFKILLSHDPTHWQFEVLPHEHHYHLTLSGHTHGMQFGIEIPGWIKWSPAKWRYRYWAGVYEENGQYINVNRGFGYLAFPGRVGIWPEISVIQLKKGSNST